MLQPNRVKQPPLQDDNSSKTTNAESIQANNHTVITLEDDHLS